MSEIDVSMLYNNPVKIKRFSKHTQKERETMKRLLGLGLICGCLCLQNCAQAITLQEANGRVAQDKISEIHYASTAQQYLNDIGIKILNANNIDKHIIFGLDNSIVLLPTTKQNDDVTKSDRYLFKSRKVLIKQDLLNHASCDDEVAALTAHEIAHCLESYKGILRGSFHSISYSNSAKKQNTQADLAAVDLLANAGYNPVALITILNKTAGQYRFEIFGEYPLATKRIENVYDYIQSKYPQYLPAYASNPYFQNAMKLIGVNKV